MPNMPDKPDTWVLVLAWLSQHAPAFYAAGFAISISALRIVYGGGTRKAAFFESLLCGCITLSMLSGLELIGIPPSAAGLLGGMVGLLGVDKVRAFADRVTGFKLPGRNAE
ncbi:MAG: phage holin, lambda family [Pseudomonas sp.]|uniref:phage holin, lambda family n=1 Tax=Pseudomonas sp. TaxID=306 RepID=UPI001B4F6C45|nr:phage holin, lambda family [Pseudomonas sp.]MBP6954046.1 phage holin, lambda family [Pseudomonas sp.]